MEQNNQNMGTPNDEFAKANYSWNAAQGNSQNTEVEPAPELPGKKKSKAPLYICIFLFLVGVAGGAFWYYNQSTAENSEVRAYEELEDNERIADYEAYLEQYPDGPHATEVKERLLGLQQMYDTWRNICVGGRQSDFERFKQNYPQSLLVRQCDVKIDSLDWLDAQADGSQAAIDAYITNHPDGRYLSEASLMQGKIADATVDDAEYQMITLAISGFYDAFGRNDEDAVFTYITPTMTKFLSKADATKADVANLISRTYNEHIQSCRFVLNNDYNIKKAVDAEDNPVYTVSFSVDQHIERDNEGKTFGSYTAQATLTSQFKISSLTMTEVSRK